MKVTNKLWIGLAVLILISPIGLILPEVLKAGSAWGEWGLDELKEIVGYVPSGMAKLAELWNAPLPDYAFRGWERASLFHQGLAYVVSAVVGTALVAGITILIGRVLARRER